MRGILGFGIVWKMLVLLYLCEMVWFVSCMLFVLPIYILVVCLLVF